MNNGLPTVTKHGQPLTAEEIRAQAPIDYRALAFGRHSLGISSAVNNQRPLYIDGCPALSPNERYTLTLAERLGIKVQLSEDEELARLNSASERRANCQ